jgi:hypothetical protein
LKKSELKDKAIDSITTLDKMGHVSESQKVKLEYIGTGARFQPMNDMKGQTKFNPSTFADTMTNMLKNDEDGNYVFVCSLLNAYHSILILIRKSGDEYKFLWKDQHENTEYTRDGLDDQFLDYAAGRYSWRIRNTYANKNNVSVPASYDEIKDKPGMPEIENQEKINLLDPDKGDWENTVVAKLQP